MANPIDILQKEIEEKESKLKQAKEEVKQIREDIKKKRLLILDITRAMKRGEPDVKEQS